jgi:two-component system, NarL family, response regulator NreC
MSGEKQVPTIRVLLADDHLLVRTGLRFIIDAQPDLEVVAEAGDGEEALRLALETRPDVALVDLSMPGPRAARTIADLVRECPGTRVLVVTVHDDPASLRASLAAGASGFVVKKAADTLLFAAIRTVHGGHLFVDGTRVDPAGAGDPIHASESQGHHLRLSRRERQVLLMLARGHTNAEIANLLDVSVKTIETYRGRLSEKLGLRGRAELFRFATQSGLLHPDEVDPSDIKV